MYMKQWYCTNQEEVLKQFMVDKEGLSKEEAEKRLDAHGRNVLVEGKKKGSLQIFLEQF